MVPFAVIYQVGVVESIEPSPASSSLVSFLFHLLSALQSIGTVPAIDYSEYMRAAIVREER